MRTKRMQNAVSIYTPSISNRSSGLQHELFLCDSSIICPEKLGNFMEGQLRRKKEIWSKFLGGRNTSQILSWCWSIFSEVAEDVILQKTTMEKQRRNSLVLLYLKYHPQAKEHPSVYFINLQGHITKAYFCTVNLPTYKSWICQLSN